MKNPDDISINSLLEHKFFIPSYQRGYRWTEVQVTDLLNDLWEFQDASHQMEAQQFYCLQPLVVKKRDDDTYEVIDGQQRLTTIYLILTVLKLYVEDAGKSRFSLDFETRAETSGVFLNDIDESRKDDNIDFYHIFNAFNAIKNWFSNRDGSHKSMIANLLLRDDVAGRNVKVIWYELPASESVFEAFTRLNIGKIPLTNSELIRALFLRAKNFGANVREIQQIRIAQEWDLIERSLQRDDFWYFIHNGKDTPANHIEYLFDLLVLEADPELANSKDPYRAFHYYNGLFKSNERDEAKCPDKEWRSVKQFFMMLEEWFNDRNLYHLTGFLIHLGVSITELRQEALQLVKSDFDTYLRKKIFTELFGEPDLSDEETTLGGIISEKLAELSYDSSKEKLRSILLLFNIATLFENEESNLRFPFDSFKKEKWDIEHIRSVDSSRPQRPDLQKTWLEGVRDNYTAAKENGGLINKIHEVIDSKPFDEGGFKTLYERVLELSGEHESSEVDDQLENLTLLDQSTNRSYKNAIFPVKRERILKLDRSGTFVPLCTRNIFLKCYSKKLDDMFRWTPEDKEDYREQTTKIFTQFFKQIPSL